MVTIQKRNGREVSFNPKKIYDRIKRASKGLNVNIDQIFSKTITSLPTEGVITTKELDQTCSNMSASYSSTHHDYSRLSANIVISSHHKNTLESFYDSMKILNECGVISNKLIKIIEDYGVEKVEKLIDYNNDFNFDYFAWKSFENIYLLRNSDNDIIERPQHTYMRIALWVTNSFEEAKEYFNSLANQLISPATPIMINSGKNKPQLASCVLKQNEGDSREALLRTLNDISTYSSDAAGIGLGMHNIRSKESKISTSGGNAGGLLKYLKIVNESLRFFNQQGKRPGAAAIYLEPWHKDIFDLLDIKKNTGSPELRARDIFTALWLNDNFLNAVLEDGDWYLFCPNDIKKNGLKPFHTIYGDEFESEYNKAIELGIGKKVKAKDLWFKIIESQIETGVPYLCSKDNANKKSNHKNYGTITQSNLCAEIFQYVNEETTAICTLSSLILKSFVDKNKKFNFKKLSDEVRKIVKTLNKVVDINHYSTKMGEKGGLEQRAIGIGVQGLADTFFLMDLIYTSDEAKKLNKQIFETIYFSALSESNNLCKNKIYKPYKGYENSPFSEGNLQFHLWGVNEDELSDMWDWKSLIKDIKEYGVCNSMLTASMPTASSAKVTGSYEMYEPAHSAIFNRRVIGGEVTIVNRYLINDFEEIGLWSEDLKNDIIMNDGSIQNVNFNKYLDIDEKKYEQKLKRVEFLLEKYKTIWEISQRELIDMSADRGIFIDQSQSMNVYLPNPTVSKITSSHIHAWKKGLKTLCYYVRTKAISTGAKHLGIDTSTYDVEPKVEKPENSQFECFGCGS